MEDKKLFQKVINSIFKSDFQEVSVEVEDKVFVLFSDDLNLIVTLIDIFSFEKILKTIRQTIENLEAKKIDFKELLFIVPVDADEIILDFKEYFEAQKNIRITIWFKDKYKEIARQYQNLLSKNVSLDKLNKKITSIPIGKAFHIHGVDEVLKKIYNTFELEKKKNIVLHNPLNGTGKSTTAILYASEFEDKYDHIAYVSINFDFRLSFLLTFMKSELKFKYDQKFIFYENFDLLISTLNKIEGNNLLVIDNLMTIKDIAVAYETAKNLNWKILLTSDLPVSGFENIPITNLTEQDAFKIFKFYLKKDFDEKLASVLLKKIHFNPFLIHFFAKNLLNVPNLTLDKLLKIISEKDKKVYQLKNYIKPNLSSKMVEITKSFLKYIIAIYEFQVRSFTPLQKNILTHFAVLPLQGFSLEFLAQIMGISENDKEDFENDILDLISRGWLDSDKDGIFTYPLLKSVLHKKLKPTAKKLRNYIKFIEKKLENQDIEQALEYVIFAENLISTIVEADVILAELAERLAIVYEKIGHPNASFSYLLSAEILDYFFDNSNPDHSLSEVISKLYLKSFEIERSLYFAQLTAELRKTYLPENSEQLANAYLLLAEIYDMAKNYDKAIEYVDLALDIITEIYDKSNPQRIKIENYHTYLSSKLLSNRARKNKPNNPDRNER